MKKRLLGGAVMLLVSSIALAGGRWIGNYSAVHAQVSDDDAILRLKTAQAAADLEKQMPLKIDDLTTMIAVMSADKTIIYDYKISAARSNIDINKMQQGIVDNMLLDVCRNTNTLRTLNHGASYTYHYVDQDGAFLFEFTFNQKSLSDCPPVSSTASP